jgi:hypothetical protein
MTSAKPTNVDNIEDLNLGENLKSATIDNNVENLKLGENLKPVETLDPFSPKNLRLSQAYLESTPAKKLLTTVPVRKPGQQDFLRVHHDPSFCESFAMIELRDDREEYIVHASLVPELWDEVVNKQLFLTINRQGTVFFWPIRLPTPEGKDLEWWRSGRKAAALATKNWLRVKPNMNLGAYEIYLAPDSAKLGEPEWPELAYWDLIKIAFKDYLITSLDHPVIQRLRGLK